MNIDKQITITLLETEIVELVVDHLKKEGYNISPNDVKLNVEMRRTNDCYPETAIPKFKNCTVVIKGE